MDDILAIYKEQAEYCRKVEAQIVRPKGEEGFKFFDRSGVKIGMADWMVLFSDQKYQGLAFTIAGIFEVSTIWNGGGDNKSPMGIFETIITGIDMPGGVAENEKYNVMRKYGSEEDAWRGHAEEVERHKRKARDAALRYPETLRAWIRHENRDVRQWAIGELSRQKSLEARRGI